MATSNLLIESVPDNVQDIETLLSDNFEHIDNATQASANHTDIVSFTISSTSFTTAFRHVLIGTTAAEITVSTPASARFFMIDNQTPYSVVVQVTGGGGESVTVPSSGSAHLYCDGTDIMDLMDGPAIVTTVSETNTTFSFSAKHFQRRISASNAGAITATIQPDSTYDFPIGSLLEIEQTGAGVVTLAAGAGVTLNSRGSLLATNGQYAVVYARKTAANTWTITGDRA